MVRNYKPVAGVVKPKSYTAEQLQVAVDRVKKGEAIRKVSAVTGIPRRTLTNHVGVYGPMKKSWRKVLTEWKKDPGKHYTNMPKQWFPYLLLGLRKELTNIDTLIVNAFAATGIYPLNKDRVLAKITHVNSSHTDIVSPLVIRHLEHLQEQCNTKPNTSVRAKRLLVSPGKSVTSQYV